MIFFPISPSIIYISYPIWSPFGAHYSRTYRIRYVAAALQSRILQCSPFEQKIKYGIQFNTIKSKDSFLSIRTNKYKPSDYHYTNLGSKSSSFKKSTSIDTAVSQFCDISTPGQKSGKELSVSTKAAIRRCLSVPSIKIDTCSNRCGNCSGESFLETILG